MEVLLYLLTLKKKLGKHNQILIVFEVNLKLTIQLFLVFYFYAICIILLKHFKDKNILNHARKFGYTVVHYNSNKIFAYY